jgi:hypothetical protein
VRGPEGVLEPVGVDVCPWKPQGVSGTDGLDGVRPGSRRTIGFEGAAELGDEGADRPGRCGRRVLPEIIEQYRKRDGPAAGRDQPSQQLAATPAAHRHSAALGIRDLDRPEHVDEDLHVLIVVGSRLLLIHC